MSNFYHQPSQKKLFFTIIPIAVTSAIFYWLYFTSPSSEHLNILPDSHPTNFFIQKQAIQPVAKYFQDFPLKGPNYRDQFAELGRRTQLLQKWIELNEIHNDTDFLENSIEKVASSMFPFILNRARVDDKFDNYSTPLTDLRNSYVPGSKGIVIPTGTKGVRFAIHLAGAIRSVFNSTLPIQIAFAGEKDLPYPEREKVMGVVENVEFVDITYVLNDNPMKLQDGGWAIKAFAALASKFEQTILVDADVVFVQSPDVLFEQKNYQETGALLFHDRLLWKDWFKERHDWWHKEMANKVPSKTLNSSLVWTENYSEEGDSGVVVLNKGRLSTFMGLLHICWQNTEAVRKEATYKLGHGDKESWWFGLELSNSSFAFEKHYGSILGHIRHKKEDDPKDVDKVCAFTIAHVDEEDKLLWYNGSLLKNKLRNQTEFDVPLEWMMDGVWEKGGREDLSCMKDAPVRNVTAEEVAILSKTVEFAKLFDEQEKLLGDPEKEKEEKEKKEKEEKEKKEKEEKEKKEKEEKEKKEKEEKEKKEKEEKEKKEKEEKEKKEKEENEKKEEENKS